MKIKQKRKKLKPEKQPELKRVADQVGEFIEYWGFKAIHGRIWAYLFLAGRELDTQELLQLTGVSKGLLSRAISELLAYSVIEDSGKGVNGVIRYRANPRVGEVIASVLRQREQELIEKVSRSCRALESAPPGEIPVDPRRLKNMEEWISATTSFLQLLILNAGGDQDPFKVSA